MKFFDRLFGRQPLIDQLEAARNDLEDAEETIAQLKDEAKEQRRVVDNATYKLETEVQKSEAYYNALRTCVPPVQTTEDMERLYNAVSDKLDAEGFRLYRAAEEIVGYGPDDKMYYEANFGYFEDRDGHELLSDLEKLEFGDTYWEPVPGTATERTILGEADKTTPEYQAFRKEMYAKALENMGFGDLLQSAPEAQEVSQEAQQTVQEVEMDIELDM